MPEIKIMDSVFVPEPMYEDDEWDYEFSGIVIDIIEEDDTIAIVEDQDSNLFSVPIGRLELQE